MPIRYLKGVAQSPESETATARKVVEEVLADGVGDRTKLFYPAAPPSES
jgi:hypothetical protein